MTRKKKVVYPPARTDSKGASSAAAAADARQAAINSRLVTINTSAMTGRADIVAGSRVRISGGLYAGEIGTVESLVGGMIPAAVVRTAEGRTRRARTVDLEPVREARPPTEG
jgi:hypothetical protein